MKLRPELTPPTLDKVKVERLARLAANLDGLGPGWKTDLANFNRLAQTSFTIEDFQEIYSTEDHADWVRRVLIMQAVRPVLNVTREELAEVVRRAMPANEFFKEHQAYMAIFDANVPLPKASNLIFYPPDYDEKTNTWGEGKPIGDYNPSPEQIVEWALAGQN